MTLNRWLVSTCDNNASVTEEAVVGHAETLIACSLYRVTCSNTVVTTGLNTAYMYHKAVAEIDLGLHWVL